MVESLSDNEVTRLDKKLVCAALAAIAIAAAKPVAVEAQVYRAGPTATASQPRLFQFDEKRAVNEEKAAEKRQYTPEQKQASDLRMQSGLNLLNEAKASLESNNLPAVANELVAAYDDMLSAIPHYYGHRAASLRATHNTYMELYNSQGKNVERAGKRLDNAIREAQKALSMW